MLIQEAGKKHGEIWADMQDTWSCLLDSKCNLTEDWKDPMWDRAQDLHVLPVVRGTLLGYPGHVMEFHKYGATQFNLVNGTCRPARRVSVDMAQCDLGVVREPMRCTLGGRSEPVSQSDV